MMRWQPRSRTPLVLFVLSLALLVFSFFSGWLFHPRGDGVHVDSFAARSAALHAIRTQALEAVEHEVGANSSNQPWVGDYWGGELLFGRPITHLVLGSEHYAVLEMTDVLRGNEQGFGPDGNQFIFEWGTVLRNGECIQLAADGLSAHVLPHDLVWINRGSVAHLAVVEAIPGLYFPRGVWSEVPEVRGIRILTRDGEHAGEATMPASVPEAYLSAREREPHLRVLERIPPQGEQRCWRVALLLPDGVRVEREQPAWWDAEPCTRVHDFVEIVEPGCVIAVLDIPDSFDIERVAVGTTFSRLPRLE